jgi:hypothetical protein
VLVYQVQTVEGGEIGEVEMVGVALHLYYQLPLERVEQLGACVQL